MRGNEARLGAATTLLGAFQTAVLTSLTHVPKPLMLQTK